ncbi:unnamed protein product [Ixodes hexagonus]
MRLALSKGAQWLQHGGQRVRDSSFPSYLATMVARGRVLWRGLWARAAPRSLVTRPRPWLLSSSAARAGPTAWSASSAATLGRRAARRLWNGPTVPLMGLTGVCLVRKPALVTSEEELESVCVAIRELVSDFSEGDAFRVPDKDVLTLNDLELGEHLGTGSNAAVYSARWKEQSREQEEPEPAFDLAVKVLFNYAAESTAASIWQSLHKECLPAWLHTGGPRNVEDSVSLPPHPNVVQMPVAFVDEVRSLPGAPELWPSALPPNLHPQGCGRNATLYLVMRRYDCSLEEYLCAERALSGRVRLSLLCQLLEGVAHLFQHGVAHRDLKANNLLLDLSLGRERPRLAIADFGCCLAQGPPYHLWLPFPTAEVCRGGNALLMAPEVAGAQPGPLSWIDYGRADVWAVGALCYPLWGMPLPFGGGALDSRTYRERDLPPLSEDAPPAVRALVRDMLRRDPQQRPSAALAATVCQLLLWGPPRLLMESGKGCQARQLVRWLCASLGRLVRGKASPLLGSLLTRASLQTLQEALQYLHQANVEFCASAAR